MCDRLSIIACICVRMYCNIMLQLDCPIGSVHSVMVWLADGCVMFFFVFHIV